VAACQPSEVRTSVATWPRAVRKKKEAVFSKAGRLACEACGFDFAEVYKQLGEGFAECHHTKPVSGLKPGHKTTLEDLAIVCSNCHRMIHKSRPMLNISELRSMIKST
jgi:5-methylcytosine-specific restriction enzyme A